MEEEFVVEIFQAREREYRATLYEKIEGVLNAVGELPISYAVDREITSLVIDVIKQKKPFMKAERRAFYSISKDFGEALKMHIKVYSSFSNLTEKLLYLDRTQILSLIEGHNFKELKDRLNVYYLAKKIGSEKDEN